MATHTWHQADMDVWVRISSTNAKALVQALTLFGFAVPNLSEELFLKERNVVRMGIPPMRLEILLSISALEFEDCYSKRLEVDVDGVPVCLIDRADLLVNKKGQWKAKRSD